MWLMEILGCQQKYQGKPRLQVPESLRQGGGVDWRNLREGTEKGTREGGT